MGTYLKPGLGDLLLTQITPQHVQSLLAQCRRERGLSQKTTRLIFATLKTILRQAKQWKCLREDPLESMKPPRVDEQEMDFLRPKEIPLFLKHADEPYRTLFLTAILTGMRRGELLGFQWGDVDWVNSEIHVWGTLYFRIKVEMREEAKGEKIPWQFSTPKSKKGVRTVIMSPRLKEALELYRLTCPVSPYDLVFCNKQGRPLHPENMIRRQFLPVLNRAGLRRIRFHDLRHTYTSLLLAQGENPKFIQSQLGHASIQTTMDRYAHLLPETHRSAGEKLDAMVFEQGKDGPDTVLILEQGVPRGNRKRQETHRSETPLTQSGTRRQ